MLSVAGYDSLRLAAVVILSNNDDGLKTCSKVRCKPATRLCETMSCC